MVQAVSLFLLLKAVILIIMGRLLQEGYQARYAIVKFLVDVHTIMPPYWYKLEGDDLGSVACLFGLSEPDLMMLLMAH
jgi:ATP-dependent phosphoenolpyruvate carboxykinase